MLGHAWLVFSTFLVSTHYLYWGRGHFVSTLCQEHTSAHAGVSTRAITQEVIFCLHAKELLCLTLRQIVLLIFWVVGGWVGAFVSTFHHERVSARADVLTGIVVCAPCSECTGTAAPKLVFT